MSRGLRLLGGLSTEDFLRRHWQRRPLLVRDTGEASFVGHRELFALAARDDVESRLVVRDADAKRDKHAWSLTHGPIAARMRPPLSQGAWTLLVQGVDLHVDAAHRLLHRFAFLSWARLDDVMVSFATDGGGVGAHVDAYDVFLLQLEGHRRWRVGPVEASPRWQPNVPLKLLARFEPTDEWLLGPGDMLYLPPGWGHEGVGEGPRCITASVGFRAPSAAELVPALLERLAEGVDGDDDGDDGGGDDASPTPSPRWRDPRGAGSVTSTGEGAGRIEPALAGFASRHLRRAVADPMRVALALGEWLTEPKPQVWFDASANLADTDAASGPRDDTHDWRHRGLELDRRSRMLYDAHAVYLNGESYLARGRDARLLHGLADRRALDAAACRGFGRAAQDTIDGWVAAGWVIPAATPGEETAALPGTCHPRR